MAKYEDYAQKDDTLDGEITDAQEQSQDRKENPVEMPERFVGKTAEEIAASFVELEAAYSKQGNDLGTMRQTVDEYVRLQSEAPEIKEPTPAEPVSIDDIYDDPDAAVRRVVKEETGDRIAQLEQQLQQERINVQLSGLDTKYPGWKQVAESTDFASWVEANQGRAQLAAQARSNADVGAVDALMDMWNERTQFATQANEAQRDQDLANASLESASPGQPEFDTGFSRSDLLNKRIAAKHGDVEAQAYLTANSEAIHIAYEEGHITD